MLIKATALFSTLLIAMPSLAVTKKLQRSAGSPISCSIDTKASGPVTTSAPTYELAFQKATGSCFQKASQKWAKDRGRELDQDTHIAIVNACVTDIKCR